MIKFAWVVPSRFKLQLCPKVLVPYCNFAMQLKMSLSFQHVFFIYFESQSWKGLDTQEIPLPWERQFSAKKFSAKKFSFNSHLIRWIDGVDNFEDFRIIIITKFGATKTNFKWVAREFFIWFFFFLPSFWQRSKNLKIVRRIPNQMNSKKKKKNRA